MTVKQRKAFDDYHCKCGKQVKHSCEQPKQDNDLVLALIWLCIVVVLVAWTFHKLWSV